MKDWFFWAICLISLLIIFGFSGFVQYAWCCYAMKVVLSPINDKMNKHLN